MNALKLAFSALFLLSMALTPACGRKKDKKESLRTQLQKRQKAGGLGKGGAKGGQGQGGELNPQEQVQFNKFLEEINGFTSGFSEVALDQIPDGELKLVQVLHGQYRQDQKFFAIGVADAAADGSLSARAEDAVVLEGEKALSKTSPFPLITKITSKGGQLKAEAFALATMELQASNQTSFTSQAVGQPDDTFLLNRLLGDSKITPSPQGIYLIQIAEDYALGVKILKKANFIAIRENHEFKVKVGADTVTAYRYTVSIFSM